MLADTWHKSLFVVQVPLLSHIDPSLANRLLKQNDYRLISSEHHARISLVGLALKMFQTHLWPLDSFLIEKNNSPYGSQFLLQRVKLKT